MSLVGNPSSNRARTSRSRCVSSTCRALNSPISSGASQASSLRDKASSTVASSASASKGFSTKWKAPAFIARTAVGTSPYAVIMMTSRFARRRDDLPKKFDPAHAGELIVKENAGRLLEGIQGEIFFGRAVGSRLDLG